MKMFLLLAIVASAIAAYVFLGGEDDAHKTDEKVEIGILYVDACVGAPTGVSIDEQFAFCEESSAPGYYVYDFDSKKSKRVDDALESKLRFPTYIDGRVSRGTFNNAIDLEQLRHYTIDRDDNTFDLSCGIVTEGDGEMHLECVAVNIAGGDDMVRKIKGTGGDLVFPLLFLEGEDYQAFLSR